MHITALDNATRFRDTYIKTARLKILEIGSQIIKGQKSLRDVFTNTVEYVGVDFENADGVDIALQDPYHIPVDDESHDVIIASSCFEHAEFFWLTFLEASRICKTGGLIYINSPSNGIVHRHPVDCWRFYPDSGNALARWAVRNGHDIRLLESYTSHQSTDQSETWNDFVAVFGKGIDLISTHKNRILHGLTNFTNGIIDDQKDFLNPATYTEDLSRRALAGQISDGSLSIRWS